MPSKYQLKRRKKEDASKRPTSARICMLCGFRIRSNEARHDEGEHHRVMKPHRRELDKDGKPRAHVFGAR